MLTNTIDVVSTVFHVLVINITSFARNIILQHKHHYFSYFPLLVDDVPVEPFSDKNRGLVSIAAKCIFILVFLFQLVFGESFIVSFTEYVLL